LHFLNIINGKALPPNLQATRTELLAGLQRKSDPLNDTDFAKIEKIYLQLATARMIQHWSHLLVLGDSNTNKPLADIPMDVKADSAFENI
jgi:hypothetical protein